MRRGKEGQPHSMVVLWLEQPDSKLIRYDNYFALVTAAVPAQATGLDATFDWQLGGPFSDGVHTGIAPVPGSLGRRVSAYSSSSTLLARVRSIVRQECTTEWGGCQIVQNQSR
jgi:hypothetical protein